MDCPGCGRPYPNAPAARACDDLHAAEDAATARGYTRVLRGRPHVMGEWRDDD